jgi:ATP diphosphatase
MNSRQYDLQDLLKLMSALRDPETGCPWDLKQDYRSIVPSTLEETWEVIEAIENDDFENLREELGDLLFQAVFYSRLADEDGHFDFSDVVHGIVSKLVRRHPHVFPDGDIDRAGENSGLTDEQVLGQWERIKREEKGELSACSSLLDEVPRSMPALLRAKQIQKKMASVGFDWSEPGPIWSKIEEEVQEAREVIQGEQICSERLGDELADVMFAVVNLLRFYKQDPEVVLERCNRRVTGRFHHIEQRAREQGVPLEDVSLETMDQWWEEAKHAAGSPPEQES